MTDWQPIETAPKDQVEVIVYDPNYIPSVMTAKYVSGWTISGADELAYDMMGDLPPDPEPIHWMPLPASPVRNESR